jgi:hypothetical protein
MVRLAMALSRNVSTSCASINGAVTRTIGSPAKTRSPSGTPHTSPVNRSSASRSMKRGGNSPSPAKYSTSCAAKDSASRPASASSSPAATRNRRWAGSRRTNSSKVASCSMPSAW